MIIKKFSQLTASLISDAEGGFDGGKAGEMTKRCGQLLPYLKHITGALVLLLLYDAMWEGFRDPPTIPERIF